MALSNNCNSFEIIGAKNEIRFFGKNGVSCAYVSPIVEDNNKNYSGYFDVIKWYQMMEFLDQLEEQPIVIEFEEFSTKGVHENPQIELSQFVKRF